MGRWRSKGTRSFNTDTWSPENTQWPFYFRRDHQRIRAQSAGIGVGVLLSMNWFSRTWLSLTMSWGYHPTMDELACHHRGGRSELRRVGLGSVWVLYAGWWRCPGFFFLGEAVCCRHVNHSKSRWVSTLYHFLILFTLYTSDYSSFFLSTAESYSQ